MKDHQSPKLFSFLYFNRCFKLVTSITINDVNNVILDIINDIDGL